jgi:hypothetical protein
MRAAPSSSARRVICLASLGWASCSQPMVEGAPTNSLLASPLDVTSGLAALDVAVGLANGSPDAQDLATIAAGATFMTWPALTRVATITVSTNGPTGNGGVLIRATAPVADGWHAAVLPRLPSRVALGDGSFHLLSDGRPSVRVRLGSAPVLASATVCGQLASGASVLVRFSEVVHAAATSATPLSVIEVTTVPVRGATCTTAAGPLVDRPLDEYLYLCSARLTSSDSVTISVTSGLLSNAGVEVPVTERTARLDTLTPVVGGCAALYLDP